jgi:hypothetical protein
VSTRGRITPREYLRDDPGPWSIAAPVYQGRMGRPDRRRVVPPAGLMLSPPPQVELELVGLTSGSDVAGAARLEGIGGLRESARSLSFVDDDTRIRAVGPQVIRTWTLDDLTAPTEERPESDPAADVAPPVAIEDLTGDLPDAMTSPDGSLIAMPARERGGVALAVMRASDRAVVRWVRGALSIAWSSDGTTLAIGGDWGAWVARHAPEEDH